MAFDKDLYWARRNAGLHGDGRPKTGKTHYSNFEVEAMEYHKRVMSFVDEGKITANEAKAELADAGAAAATNLLNTGAPEIVAAVVEQLVIYGSYEALQKASKEQTQSESNSKSDTETKD